MNDLLSRRVFLKTLSAVAPCVLPIDRLWAGDAPGKARGVLVGEPTAARIAARVFADGGNAFDAAVAGGLAGEMSSPHQYGIGGYGGHATLVTAGGKKIASIDFNTIAPGEARADMFQPRKGDKRPPDNEHGWLAAGVPGILAGLQFVLDNYGSRKLPDMLQPAIALARDGVPAPGSITPLAKQFAADPASRRLYFQDDRPLRPGERLRNPDLADMLSTLAKRGSVESFYRGDIALRIAEAFLKNGGIVTAKDMGRFAAREERPLAMTMTMGELTVHTAPLTAGGMTFIQALRILQALRWQRLPAGLARTHARIEAMRLAWREAPEAEPFPSDTLPKMLAHFVEAVGLAKHCPPDYAAIPLLKAGSMQPFASRGKRPCRCMAGTKKRQPLAGVAVSMATRQVICRCVNSYAGAS